ncbi:MAG TPA: pyridoxamine 5'-phosphate oxidase family protein [Myxococcales bacterium]
MNDALKLAQTTTFCTFRNGSINARCMLFANEESLRRFFVLTHRATEKLEDLQADHRATLCILSLPASGELEQAAETIVQGTTVVTASYSDDWVPDALRRLARKQPQLAAMVQAETLGDYRLVRLDASRLVFRTYQETLLNVPKTILQFATP